MNRFNDQMQCLISEIKAVSDFDKKTNPLQPEQLADQADTAAKAAVVLAAVAKAGAVVAAPTGLSALGVSIGLVSTPFIVTAAPILGGVAAGALALSAATGLYLKFKRKK